jgi:hypothetical protein
MTAHVDEFDPRSRWAPRGVQTDALKLKFNNIRSCIAVGIVPHTGGQLIGVHFTTSSTQTDPNEMDTAFATVTNLLAGSSCDVYLVAAWGYHADTKLLKKLKNFASTIYLSDVTPSMSNEADVDVKMEKTGGAGVVISVRQHVVQLPGQILKAKYATPGAARPNVMQTGKNLYQSDRDSKPWLRVQPVRIHPAR